MAREPHATGWAVTYVDNPIDSREVPFEYGGLLARFAALIVDRIVSGLLAVPVAIALIVIFVIATDSGGSGDETGPAIAGWVVGYAGVTLLYDWITTARGGGLRKRWLNLKVIREPDGAKPRLGTAAIRVGVIWALSWVPIIGSLLFLASCAWALGDRRQAWHDLAAKTIVVKRYA